MQRLIGVGIGLLVFVFSSSARGHSHRLCPQETMLYIRKSAGTLLIQGDDDNMLHGQPPLCSTAAGPLKWKLGKRGGPFQGPGAAVHSKQEWKGNDRCLRAQLAAAIDKQASTFQQCKRRLSDAQNEARNPRKRTPCARNHRADREERARINSPKELEECVHRHGCKFVILCGLWLALGTGDCEAFFKTPLDDEYDAELYFGADDPDGDEHDAITHMRSKIRSWDEANSIFLNPSISHYIDIHEVLNTAPGGTASATVWAIWLFSSDETFSETGDVTGINYYHHFNI
ncbi:hypothetical protein DFH08DRAFT_813900 [Mycena albidolilacea]|uniref:Uncharacterized protein n=1 Tax=Mycena albidolilacea TaxID=1033008 RepID=A0AAD7EKR4_9AGAR|nr:hypothetical protein DFH08DRAFT_813900 [Mycena albidolilacea]